MDCWNDRETDTSQHQTAPGHRVACVRHGLYFLTLLVVVGLFAMNMRWGLAALGVVAVAYVCDWMERMLRTQSEILLRLDELERAHDQRATPAPAYSPPVHAGLDEATASQLELPH